MNANAMIQKDAIFNWETLTMLSVSEPNPFRRPVVQSPNDLFSAMTRSDQTLEKLESWLYNQLQPYEFTDEALLEICSRIYQLHNPNERWKLAVTLRNDALTQLLAVRQFRGR
jgi:hypothetical protein